MKSKKALIAIVISILVVASGVAVYAATNPTSPTPEPTKQVTTTPKEDAAEDTTTDTEEAPVATTAPAPSETTSPTVSTTAPTPVIPTEELTPEELALAQARTWRPKGDVMCTSVLTPARHIGTGARYTFPSGCIPPGWVVERSGTSAYTTIAD